MSITVKDIYKSFDGKSVLKGISMTVGDTGAYAIMGVSGIGKTTLLRIIAGLEKPDSGTVSITEKKLGYVFQEPRLLEWMTALENVSLPILNEDNANQIAEAELKKVELSDSVHLYPSKLSGGMQQRVSLARGFAYGGALLLDEPFKELDDALKTKMLELTRSYTKQHPVIIVTHDINEAKFLTDNIMVI